MKIICIGRNYVAHARELNNPVPEDPVFFLKPESALLPRNHPFYYPGFTQDLQYETELVYRIKKVGKSISRQFAHTYYDEVGLGIDFTARDIQQTCKARGLPWEVAKAFDFSAPVSQHFLPLNAFNHEKGIDFSLKLNGETVQQGNSREMLFDIDHIITHISQYMTLKMGDLIFTGTPAGVGAVEIGDRLEGYIGEDKLLDITIK